MTRPAGSRLGHLGPAVLTALAAALAAMLPAMAASGAEETAPRLRNPVACTVGSDCFVQNYVDRIPGPVAQDFTCGPLTNDGHNGTDIRLLDLAAMRAGVDVVAAAPGSVRATRDGMADVSLRDIGRQAVEGRECGNGVVIDHGGGWETQYCHMRRGSIAVGRGETVAAGRTLGQVGLSGETEFPHLHFAVRRDGEVVDPYVGPGQASGCGGVVAPLWTAAAARALAYRASGLLGAGFADTVPELAEVEAGRHREPRLAAGGQVLVFWSHVFGLREGDVQELELREPDGRVVVRKRGDAADRNQATAFRYVGKRLRSQVWPPGVYRGRYRLLRGDVAVIEASREVELR